MDCEQVMNQAGRPGQWLQHRYDLPRRWCTPPLTSLLNNPDFVSVNPCAFRAPNCKTLTGTSLKQSTPVYSFLSLSQHFAEAIARPFLVRTRSR